jgi:hypothetical protein
MDWPESFAHVIGREQVCNSSKPMKQVILESKQWCWPYDRSFWKNLSYDFLASCLKPFISPSRILLLSLFIFARTLVLKNSDGEFLSAL